MPPERSRRSPLLFSAGVGKRDKFDLILKKMVECIDNQRFNES